MEWIQHTVTGTTVVEIYSNVTPRNADIIFYKRNRSFFKFVKTIADPLTLIFNDVEYQIFGGVGAYSTCELTTYLQPLLNENTLIVQIDDDTNSIILSLDVIVKEGLKPTATVTDVVPSVIPIVKNSIFPFYLQLIYSLNWHKNDNTILVLGQNDEVTSNDLQPNINSGDYSNFLKPTVSTFDDTFDYSFRYKMDKKDVLISDITCPQEMILVEWESKFGAKKSWWFKVLKLSTNNSKELELTAYDSGFNVLKNKQISIVVTHKNCDEDTQMYLSDICISDAVYIYDGDVLISKKQVNVATKNIEVEKKRKDIQLTINTMQYDII